VGSLNEPPANIKIAFVLEDAPNSKIEELASAGEFLNQVAHRAKVVIQQTCGGVPSCTDCKVVVKEGVDHGFEPPLGPELRLLGNVYFITRERLSCQAIVQGDATVYVPRPQRKSERKKLLNKK